MTSSHVNNALGVINLSTTQYSEQVKIKAFIVTPDVFNITAMVDSGAQGNFINKSFVEEWGLDLKKKKYPKTVQVVDGREISNG